MQCAEFVVRMLWIYRTIRIYDTLYCPWTIKSLQHTIGEHSKCHQMGDDRVTSQKKEEELGRFEHE